MQVVCLLNEEMHALGEFDHGKFTESTSLGHYLDDRMPRAHTT